MTPAIKEILPLVLNPERSTPDRLNSLQQLSDFIHEDDVVLELARSLDTENSIEVREALLRAILNVDITRIHSRAELARRLIERASLEPERELRLTLLRRLIDWLPQESEIETLLAWNLTYELDPQIQLVCLEGLRRSVHKTAETVQQLLDFASHSPSTLRSSLVELFSQFDTLIMAEGFARLLDPFEDVALRTTLIDRLSQMPLLPARAISALTEYWPREPVAALQKKILDLLTGRARVSRESLHGLLEIIRVSPDQVTLLSSVENRLGSFPDLVPELTELVETSSSIFLKRRLLDLMKDVDALPLFITCLSDGSPIVRQDAIALLRRRIQKQPGAICAAFCERFPKEPLFALRFQMLDALQNVEQYDDATEAFLMGRSAIEDDPRLRVMMAWPLLRCSVTDNRRATLLTILLRLLKDPLIAPPLRDAIQKRLEYFFAWKNEPALFDCLSVELDHEQDVRKTEGLYRSLQSLNPSDDVIFPIALRILYRFGDSYSMGATDLALQDVYRLAATVPAARKELRYLSQLTEAAHLLDRVDGDELKEVILDEILKAVRTDHQREGAALLSKAYEQHNLKKSHLIALFITLLDYAPRYPLLDEIVEILKTEKIMTPDLLDAAFNHWLIYSNDQSSFILESYLKKFGPSDPSWITRLESAFNPSAYAGFCDQQEVTQSNSSTPKSWDDSRHWSNLYHPEWPLAKMVVEFKGWSVLLKGLISPIDPAIPVGRSFQYFSLYQLSHVKHNSLTVADIEAIARLVSNAAPVPEYLPLLDRIYFVLSENLTRSIDQWMMDATKLSPDARLVLTQSYLEQCRRCFEYRKKSPITLPVPLPGMDLDAFAARWPDATTWPLVWKELSDYLVPEYQPPVSDSKAGPVSFKPLNTGYTERLLSSFAALTPPPHSEPFKTEWAAFQERVRQRYPKAYKNYSEAIVEAGGFPL